MSDGLRAFLSRLPDLNVRNGLQRMVDRLVAAEAKLTDLDQTVLKTGSPVDAYDQRIKNLADPRLDTDAVSLGYLRKYVGASLQALEPVAAPERDAGPGGGVGFPPPTGTFTATPSSLGAGGGTVTFQWTSQNATSVEHSYYGALALAGSATLFVATSTTYTILLRGPGGITTLSLVVTVATTPPETPAPTGTFQAIPATISPGQTVTLTWTSANADTATINNGVGAVAPVAVGTATVSPPQSTTYELRLVGPGGITVYTAAVVVNSQPPPPQPSGYNAGILNWGFSNNGVRFEWKGVTAFAVLADLMQGREHQAYDFLQWMAASGVTVPRILCALAGSFWEDKGIRLYPTEHPDFYTKLGALVAYCNTLGMMPEIVIFGAFSEIWGTDFNAMLEHSRRCAQALMPYRGCFIEMANEWDAIGFTSGNQVRLLAEAYLSVDPNRPVACSSATGDSDYYTGYIGPPSKYLTVHIRRIQAPYRAQWVIAHYGNPSFMHGIRPCVSDEPVNAGAALYGIHEEDPQYWYAFGAMSRLMGYSTTFHYEGGLFTQLPSGSAWNCFKWWYAGLNYPSPDSGGQLFAATPAGVAFGPCPWPNSGTNYGLIGRTTSGGGAYAVIFGGAALPAVSAGWGSPQVDGFTTGLFTPPGAPPTTFTDVQCFFVPPAGF